MAIVIKIRISGNFIIIVEIFSETNMRLVFAVL